MTATTASDSRPLRRDAAHNRERLLAAATTVFAEHGLDAGVDEVARVAGVGIGTLYRRFPSKEALIDELVADIRRDLLDTARTASTVADGLGLETLLFATGAMQAEHRGCLARLWTQTAAGIEAVRQFREIMDDLLGQAQAAGRVRADITPGDVSMMLWSVSSMIETTSSYAPSAWRRHLELLVAGLRPAGVPAEFREPALTVRPLPEAPTTA